MFGITHKHIQPILKLVEQFPPPAPADTSKLGAWGIVFLCCGAMATRNRRWGEKLMNSLNDIGPSAMMRTLLGENDRSDEDYAVRFSDHIVQWCNDNHALAVARRRMEKYGESMSPAALRCNITYVQLAYCLNSFRDKPLEELLDWDEQDNSPDFGWPELFFAAGLVLHNEESVRWHELVSTIHGMSGSFKAEVVAIFEHYAGRNLFENPKSAGVITNQLKRGMRIKLRNGWEALVVEECKENILEAKVFGDFTETGSIYAHDVVAVQIDGSWVEVKMTEAQRRFHDELSRFYGR